MLVSLSLLQFNVWSTTLRSLQALARPIQIILGTCQCVPTFTHKEIASVLQHPNMVMHKHTIHTNLVIFKRQANLGLPLVVTSCYTARLATCAICSYQYWSYPECTTSTRWSYKWQEVRTIPSTQNMLNKQSYLYFWWSYSLACQMIPVQHINTMPHELVSDLWHCILGKAGTKAPKTRKPKETSTKTKGYDHTARRIICSPYGLHCSPTRYLIWYLTRASLLSKLLQCKQAPER